jgi:hypothetical protein
VRRWLLWLHELIYENVKNGPLMNVILRF